MIKHEAVLGFDGMEFKVDLKKITKSAKNRSYPNLSNCCGVELKQKKYCSGCNEEITDTSKEKLFKLGKERYKVSTDHLNQIKTNLDDERIKITEYRDRNEIDDTFYADILFQVRQHAKYRKDYTEFYEVLARSGKVAIGKLIYNNRPYPVMIYSYKGTLMVRALRFADEVTDLTTVDKAPMNEEKVKLLIAALKLSEKDISFNVEHFNNEREEMEQELIMKCVNGEELPEVEKIEVVTKDDTEEMEKLKQLLVSKGITV